MIARLRARPGREAELGAALAELVPHTVDQPGCLRYDLHVAEGDAAEYCLYEVWQGHAEHAANLATPHLTKFASRLDDLLDGGIQATLLRRYP